MKSDIQYISLLLFLFTTVLFPQQFRFAVWGDSQFQNPDVFKETVRRTELLNPAFVIHVGDMIHGYTYNIDNARRQWTRFKKQISPLSVPFYPTPGNHDVTTREIQPAYLEAWGEDKLYYSFDYQNSHFIIVNTYLDQNFDTIPQNELNWLKADLEKSKAKDNIFITMHSPLYLNQKYDWTRIHDMLKEYPVRAVFTGHYHSYDYRVIDGIKYFCLNSSGNMSIYNEMAGRSHNFLFITVDGNKNNIAVITRESIYRPDFVKPGQASRASILESDKTIIINSPADGIDTTIYIGISNNAAYPRRYVIQPEIFKNWNFQPYGYQLNLGAGESDSVLFRIQYQGPYVKRNELPGFEIETDYITSEDEKVDHEYSVYLFHPPVTTAVPSEGNILIDGKDTDPFWKSAPSINELYVNSDNLAADEKTIVKVLYDENNIYVFIKGTEPETEGLSSAAYGDIPLVFGDDDFELYFDTNRDLKTFYRLMVNPAGTILSSGPQGRFTFKFEVKTFVGPDFWSAEFKIPLNELEVNYPLTGKTWGFNVRRHRQQAETPQSDWSKMNTYPPYQPEYFGLLNFN